MGTQTRPHRLGDILNTRGGGISYHGPLQLNQDNRFLGPGFGLVGEWD